MTWEALEMMTTKVEEAQRQLGVHGQAKVEKLKGSEFMRHCVNAKVLKEWIQAQLIAQKFEQSRVEWAYHHQVNSKVLFVLFVRPGTVNTDV